MLLLYQRELPRSQSEQINLHSTMLLLYRRSEAQDIWFSTFTFHYASTLSRRTRWTRCVSSIYIPLCFYFILIVHSRSFQRHLIYIPLCFYFISGGTAYFVRRNLNLHSTMLLLYLDHLLEYPVHIVHLHSTMLLLYQVLQRGRYSVSEFTFHYASTLSATYEGYTAFYRNLHSTMLLLYRQSGTSWKSETARFTFHYASTLSYRLGCDSLVVSHLHSTMLLLYLNRSADTIEITSNLHSTMLLLYRLNPTRLYIMNLIYIPLCFYFIEAEGADLLWGAHIYIPLCFYFIGIV